ncbi:hypothetical protein EJ110_NYTH55474 [Nymphaea thermarum]|nr:hypothetical protein EJ110_NYTH55474 [Nymphaea thermarum]
MQFCWLANEHLEQQEDYFKDSILLGGDWRGYGLDEARAREALDKAFAEILGAVRSQVLGYY